MGSSKDNQRESLPVFYTDDEDSGSETVVTDRSKFSWSAALRDERCDVLTIVRGPETGRVVELVGRALRVGRAPSCEIRIDDNSVSRVHVLLSKEEGRWVLEDPGSSNGTFLAGERVQRRMVEDGDVFQLGPRVMLRFNRESRAQAQMMRQLYESSVKDPLTGVSNRRHLDARLQEEMSFAARHGTDLAVLIIDVDHFKRVNDTHGHDAGDVVLKQLARSMRAQIRAEDFLARYGGEEFMILARGIGLKDALAFGGRLCSVVESLSIKTSEQRIGITVSIGVSTLGACGRSLEPRALIKAADENLYRAKQAGRNRVVGS